MSMCSHGAKCVWGKKNGRIITCAMPRCVVYELRSGYLDRLTGQFVRRTQTALAPETYATLNRDLSVDVEADLGVDPYD